MDKFPVNPGTPISLPKPREDAPVRKPSRLKLPPTPEEQVKRLRKRCRWLTVFLILFLTGCIVLGVVSTRLAQKNKKPARGQNYSTMETSVEASTQATAAD